MSFFSEKKAPAASRRAHKKSFKQHQQHKNKTRTRRTRRKRKESKKKKKKKEEIKVQRVENGQNIHEKNGFDHNFNIVLSVFNIKNFNNINFF